MYQQAADRGDTLAMYNLAVSHREGFGCDRSLPKFEIWMKRAADKGSLAAQVAIAKYYDAAGPAATSLQKMEAAKYWEMAVS